MMNPRLCYDNMQIYQQKYLCLEVIFYFHIVHSFFMKVFL